MTSQTIITESEFVLVVEQESEPSIITTEVEIVVLVEDTEVVLLEATEQGPPGPAGLVGYVNQRREFLALVDGEQLITLPSVPTVGAPINVYLNGLLHATSADYSSSSNILTITPAVGVMAGDHITILYQ